MSVEESHGIFQFTDDLFEDAAPKERVFTVDKSYTPREIFPGWFETGTLSISTAQEARNPIDTLEYLIPELYRRGDYETCLKLSRERIEKYHSTTPGIVRDAAETASLCLLKLGRPMEALPILPLMTGVEEPGRLIIRSLVFIECGCFDDSVKECREYLKLRPGDYSITIRLADCLQRLDCVNNCEEIMSLLSFAESTLSMCIEQAKISLSGRLHEKYCRDLDQVFAMKFAVTQILNSK